MESRKCTCTDVRCESCKDITSNGNRQEKILRSMQTWIESILSIKDNPYFNEESINTSAKWFIEELKGE